VRSNISSVAPIPPSKTTVRERAAARKSRGIDRSYREP
jgi:hypothetical protein